jgi:Tol biopolymer transport system component/predicted Ser/Thr protein kinase
MIGKTLSHYRILEKLGEGGMGVVYKAEDTKLKREVAIKFLPRQIAASEEERARFKIEAQAAAALNHPNIAHVYAIEEVDDEMFIVMEYIEGQELREIVGAGFKPSPMLTLDKILDYATQIACGLQAAHEKDVTHRDIKSANIMITGKGKVKIMDFGLAKIRGGAQFTKVGTTLGTTAYMSPEQTQGMKTDHRTDIWAFGVVLYEMLTGKMPFPGDYEQAVIYSILNEEPEFPEDIQENLKQIVQKAMAKNLNERYQNIGEVLVDFEALGAEQSAAVKSVGTGLKPVPIKKLPILIGGLVVLALLAIAVIGYFFPKRKPADLKIVSTRPLTSAPGFEGSPTWSPEGTRIAYTSDESGRQDIWVRQISAGQSVNLTKDYPGNNNMAPTWSPDGEWIAFLSDREEGGLFAMPALGGNARQILVSEELVLGVSWSPDASKLIFTTDGIYTISAQGGDTEQVPFQSKGLFLQHPAWSPDGKRIAIVEVMGLGISTSRLWSIRTDGTNPRRLTDANSFDNKPVWAPDGKRILFVSDRGGSSDIWWIPIDENGGASGPAKALTTGVGVGAIALSADGTKLAYEKTVQSSSIWSMPIMTDGVLTMQDAQLVTSENSFIETIAISPDAEWLAFDSNRSGNVDIWIIRPDGTNLRQITTHQAHEWIPTWSPDSKRIAFHSLRSGNRDIWIKPVAGGAARQLTTDPGKDWQQRWSPNSEEIAFISHRDGHANVWVLTESASRPRQVTFHKEDGLYDVSWSPNGERLVFGSSQTGSEELYLTSPNAAQTEQLTQSQFKQVGAFAWSPNGSIIYAIAVSDSDITRNIYAISATDGTARKLTNFESQRSKFLTWATSDGERFYLVFNEQKSDIWVAELTEEE